MRSGEKRQTCRCLRRGRRTRPRRGRRRTRLTYTTCDIRHCDCTVRANLLLCLLFIQTILSELLRVRANVCVGSAFKSLTKAVSAFKLSRSDIGCVINQRTRQRKALQLLQKCPLPGCQHRQVLSLLCKLAFSNATPCPLPSPPHPHLSGVRTTGWLSSPEKVFMSLNCCQMPARPHKS